MSASAPLPHRRARQNEAGDLRALIDASPAAIIELDRNGRVREWNRAAERLLGWPADEVLGELPPVGALGDTLDLQAFLSAMDDGLAPEALQLRCRRRDGRTVEVEFSPAATRDRDGKLHSAMGLLIDITDRLRLERKLQHQALHDSLTGLPIESSCANGCATR